MKKVAQFLGLILFLSLYSNFFSYSVNEGTHFFNVFMFCLSIFFLIKLRAIKIKKGHYLFAIFFSFVFLILVYLKDAVYFPEGRLAYFNLAFIFIPIYIVCIKLRIKFQIKDSYTYRDFKITCLVYILAVVCGFLIYYRPDSSIYQYIQYRLLFVHYTYVFLIYSFFISTFLFFTFLLFPTLIINEIMPDFYNHRWVKFIFYFYFAWISTIMMHTRPLECFWEDNDILQVMFFSELPTSFIYSFSKNKLFNPIFFKTIIWWVIFGLRVMGTWSHWIIM